MERKLNAIEVMFLVGIAPKTLERWYAFKRSNPTHELSKQLPDFEQPGGFRTPRYWKESDIEKLIEFKKIVPHGRSGLFESITHQNKYKQEKRKENKNGKKPGRSRGSKQCNKKSKSKQVK